MQIVLGHPTGGALLLPLKAESNTTVLVGPEGGFTDDEVQLAERCGAHRIQWPDTILRIETAAIVLATLMLAPR
jgi:16S rRNA (uracil1498-N3)-methyltransferase